MSTIKIVDLKQNSLELELLNDRELSTIRGGSADYSDSNYIFDGSNGDQKVAIVTQSLFNNNQQIASAGSNFSGNLNSNYNSQSNSATAD